MIGTITPPEWTTRPIPETGRTLMRLTDGAFELLRALLFHRPLSRRMGASWCSTASAAARRSSIGWTS